MPHYKLGIYGEPATGKSVFALHFPKPFFITTDSNYEFLYEFGAKEEDHKQVTSWAEFKKFIATFDFSKYETIVLDVIEDLYLWAESEYCIKNRIEDLSDVGYGKAYKIVRNDFAVEIFKLISKNANIIILTHCDETQGKTQRGGDFTAYAPSKVIPDKVWSMIQGRLRFFFKAHLEDVTEGDKIVTKRMLSISPKPHELQINRGMNVESYPSDIELDFKTFCDTLKLDVTNTTAPSHKKDEAKIVNDKPKTKIVINTKPNDVFEPKVEVKNLPYIEEKTEAKPLEVKEEKPKKEDVKALETPKVETPKTENKVESAQEKLARIREMLAKQKK